MQNFLHSKEITETKAINMIFDACRANEDRLETKFVDGKVCFKQLTDGTHEVFVYNCENILVACAIVDEFDI